MKYSLKILSSKDFDKVANRYPKKQQDRILNSWGFADKKRNLAFVRSRRRIGDVAPVAMHEIMELLATVSPHDEDGIRTKGKEPKAPEIKYATAPEYGTQMELFKKYQEPYLESQEKLYSEIFEPTTRQIGGLLQADLTEPFQLDENVWTDIWQRARERTLGEFEPIERRTTQRLAGKGALDTSGQALKAFQDIDLSKAKSIEDLAVDQAIAEWTEKKSAKQQSYSNIFNYLGATPSFNIPMPQAQPYIQPGEEGELNVGQQIGSWFAPPYADTLRGQGYNVSAPSTTDTAQMAMMAAMMMCLPKDTFIELDEGYKKVQDLRIGDKVKGGTVIAINSEKIDTTHKFYKFTFKKGVVIASLGHPFYDTAIDIKETDLTGDKTYDILTDSKFYYINGVKVASTLDVKRGGR